MIPDDAVLVINQEESRVKTRVLPDDMVVYVCERGFPGTLDPATLAHIHNRSNPHEDSVDNTVVPTGHDGKWLKLGDASVTVTDEVPLYIEDIRPIYSDDGLVRVDRDGPNRTLAEVAAYPFGVTDALRLRGDSSDASKKVAPRMFYGTDAAGTAGFNLVPGKRVIP